MMLHDFHMAIQLHIKISRRIFELTVVSLTAKLAYVPLDPIGLTQLELVNF